ncbi:MAG TPA: M4 family metallopeptidase [Vicinamibacterales bacterium]|nr:M4 family metallopeptidase [Vicinamibacterales bacterium]
MFASRRVLVWHFVWAMLVCLTIASAWRPTSAQQPERSPRGLVSFATRPSQPIGELRDAASLVTGMRRAGELRLRMSRVDALVRGRTHERLDQYYRGVRVFGGDVAQQLNGGQVVSLYGNVYDDIAIDPSPALAPDEARTIVEAKAGVDIGRRPELVVLPRDGGYTLTWRVRAATGEDVREYFVDAHTGAIAFEYSDLKTQGAVGRGTGVLGDTKKISVSPSGDQFVTTDRLRPPAINTYDMKGDFTRTIRYLNEVIQLAPSDLGTDSDNTWTDTAAVDAHVYAGYTYDYYFKRHNRRGLDNRDLAIVSLVHPVRRQDFQQNFRVVPDFYLNAGYYGDGVMLYGEGLPAGFTVGGQTVDYFSGALDIVAHELTHGVTDYSSGLIYRNESGALNEAFSDIMGAAVEFFFQPAGNGTLRADYLCGEDVFRPGGIRSMSDPRAFGDPDHYSQRYTGVEDNGGVHSNSGIANNAFYLAIEGGTNRTSGLSVQGVGGSNREQIERVFYRAFTQLLPSNATFSVARAATIQAARDLFGGNSNAERAVTQAWTAVGVQ